MTATSADGGSAQWTDADRLVVSGTVERGAEGVDGVALPLLLEQGVELVVIKELLGHAHIGVTATVYAHVRLRLVAVECLRSWKRMRRRPAFRRSVRKARVRLVGSIGRPRAVVNTCPSCCHVVPAAS